MKKVTIKSGMTIRSLQATFEKDLKPLAVAKTDATIVLPKNESMDCAFLQALLELKKTFDAAGKTLVVENVPDLFQSQFDNE